MHRVFGFQAIKCRKKTEENKSQLAETERISSPPVLLPSAKAFSDNRPSITAALLTLMNIISALCIPVKVEK